MVDQKIKEYQEAIKTFDLKALYEPIISSLWYGTLACSGVVGISGVSRASADFFGGENYYDTSFLKYCTWRGVLIECAAIFSPFPTDKGVCCSFNLKAAEEIYHSKTYSTLLKKLQEHDKNNSVSDPTLPINYTNMGEPKTYAGRNKGLYLILDAHSNLFTATSLEQDYTSFTGLISYSGSFPYLDQEGFEIKPGHHNMVSLTAMKIDADDSMYNLDKYSRNCRFYEESSNLKIYRNYTFANCLFECSLLKAYEEYECSPWYFPIAEENIRICDPWTTKKFLDSMNKVKNTDCPTCLPECNTTIYDSSVITIPFRECDAANIELSFLCKVSQTWGKPLPKKFSLYLDNTSTMGHGFKPISSDRSYNTMNKYSFNKKINEKYDAFDVDIATVDIYFKKSTALQLGRKSKMSWIDYLSTVGGLLGLVLGMGFVSFIEVIWLLIRLIARIFELNQLIS
jgi:hypothetical protein